MAKPEFTEKISAGSLNNVCATLYRYTVSGAMCVLTLQCAFSEMVDAKTTFLTIDGVEHRHDKSVLLSPVSHGFPLVSLFPAHSRALYSLFTFPPEPFAFPTKRQATSRPPNDH